ncbi:hypothetical protein Tco_0605895 [Tanacetum coccineum]
MKHWKSGFFLIDRWTISGSMVWRHPSAAIDDPRPAAGSFSMADVRRLSAHVIKLRDIPKGVLVLSRLSRVWKSHVQEEPHLDVRPTLKRLPFYCTPPVTADAVILDPTLEDLAVGTPSSKIFAKAEASQKSALAQSSGSTTHPSLFVGDSDDESDGDDNACVEIPLVTPIRSAAVIPSSRNQGGSSVALTTEDSWGKGIMADDAAASSVGVSRPRPSSGPIPSFRDVSGVAIHANNFPFSAGPYYATYPKGGVAGNYKFTRKEWDAPYRTTFGVLTKEVFKDPVVGKTVMDQFPTPREMVQVESLSDDQLTMKMSVLHYMMMSHGGELLARYRGLNQSHHEYVLLVDSRLKGYEEKVASLTGLELQSKAKGKERKTKIKSLTKSLDNLHAKVACLSTSLNRATILEAEKDEEILHLEATPPEVQGELLSLAASVGFEHGLSMHRTKDEFAAVLKKMANFLPGAHDRLAEASFLVAQTDYAFLNMISDHATKPLSVILQIEPKKLAGPANVPTSRDARVSPSIVKESTVTPASKSLKLSTNVAPAPSVVALDQNKEWVNAMVDGPDAEKTDGVTASKSRRSERVSSNPTDVVVALSIGEKGDGSLPSSAVDEEA